MSAATLREGPRALLVDPSGFGAAGVRSPLRRSDGGGLTLEQKLDRVWEGLHAAGAAVCPVCRGRMAAAPADPAGGRCGDCGTALS